MYGKMSHDSKKTDNPMKGGMAMWIKKAEIHRTDAMVVAYRDGTNNVCLGLTTEHDRFHWDMVARYNNDAAWYFDLNELNATDW